MEGEGFSYVYAPTLTAVLILSTNHYSDSRHGLGSNVSTDFKTSKKKIPITDK